MKQSNLKPGFLISALYMMPSLREIRNLLLFAHNNNLINEGEFLLLYDLDKSRNLRLSYWSYYQFDLDLLTDDECTLDSTGEMSIFLPKRCRFRIK